MLRIVVARTTADAEHVLSEDATRLLDAINSVSTGQLWGARWEIADD